MKKTKLSKKRKLLLSGIGAFSLAAVSVGVGVPMATSSQSATTSTATATKTASSDFTFNENGTVTTKNLVFSSSDLTADANTVTKSSVLQAATETETVDAKADAKADATTATEDKWSKTEQVTTQSGEKKDILVSKVYDNNRKFMPILAYDNGTDYYGYNNSRSNDDFWFYDYPGWTRTKLSLNYTTNGTNLYQYTATKELVDSGVKLETQNVKFLVVSMTKVLDLFGENGAKAQLEKILTSSKDVQYIQFKELSDWNVDLVPDLSSYTNIKKLDLVGLDGGRFTTLGNLKMPESVEELSIYGPDLKAIDPLQLPKNAALIYDLGNGATFDVIDLSKHKDLTTEQLQEAVNAVYSQRINERGFQSNFAGGYIYSWNLRGTGVTSFNDVEVPELNDGTGRFYIDYVAVESSGIKDGVVNETINNTDKPSNDSRISQWYDWNTESGWSTVKTVNVAVKDNAKVDDANFDNVVNEIVSFLNKYTNVKTIDISKIQFSGKKTANDLKEALTSAINAKYADPVTGKGPDITIVTAADATTK
ncbi:MAG: IgG-blocking protein M [Malacoplasma sp.]|nr:IgG-blocking protein M [Malacoplasma sp.]